SCLFPFPPPTFYLFPGSPGLISASPYGHGFPQAFTLQQAAGLSMPGALASFGMGPGGMAASRLGLQALGGGGGQAGVLLVSNLNPESVTPNCLFILFGMLSAFRFPL
ncbi:unnamed protein product, partial [Oncorhynchus mykiss]